VREPACPQGIYLLAIVTVLLVLREGKRRKKRKRRRKKWHEVMVHFKKIRTWI
jgi:hypothetical protein